MKTYIFYNTIMSIYNTHEIYKSNKHVRKFIRICKKYYNFYTVFTLTQTRTLSYNFSANIKCSYNQCKNYYFHASEYITHLVEINDGIYNSLIFYKKIYRTIIKKLHEYKINKIKFMKIDHERMLKEFEYVLEEYDVNAKLLDSLASISLKTN